MQIRAVKERLGSSRVMMLVIFVVTTAVYSRSLFCPFYVVDDGDYVLNNLYVINGLSIDDIWWAFTAFHSSNWHPVTWLSLMVDSQLFGMNPMGYHLINVIIHGVNASLLFLLFHRMTGTRWRSAFVAACFALHPLHVESVVWISERKDVLSALFWMISLLLYCSYVKNSRRSSYWLSLAAFAVGLMAKPMLVTLPVVMLLLDFWPLERFSAPPGGGGGAPRLRIKSLLLEKAPFLLLSLLSSILTLYAQNTNRSIATLAAYPLLVRVDNALWSLLGYARKMLLPFDLAVYYPMITIPAWKAACVLVLLCSLLWLSLKQLRRRPWFAVGLLWFLVTLSPVIGLIQVADQAMADRYSYLPLIGLFTIVAWKGAECCRDWPRWRGALAFSAAGLLVCCAGVTLLQVSYWDDNVRLIKYSLSNTDKSFFAYRILGAAYEQVGKPELAVAPYREALRINPRDPGTHNNLGNILDNEGRVAEAVSEYQAALRTEPHFSLAHFNLGLVLERFGAIDRAEREYRETLKDAPGFKGGHESLGRCLSRQGRLDEAIEEFSAELRLHPELASARAQLDLARRQRQRLHRG